MARSSVLEGDEVKQTKIKYVMKFIQHDLMKTMLHLAKLGPNLCPKNEHFMRLYQIVSYLFTQIKVVS